MRELRSSLTVPGSIREPLDLYIEKEYYKERKGDLIMEMTSMIPDYENEIISIVKSNMSPKALGSRLEDYHESNIAEALEKLNVIDRKKLFRVLEASFLSNVLEYVDEEIASLYLNEMDIKKAVLVLESMESNLAADVLREVDKEKRAILIDCMDEEAKRNIALLSSYSEDEIGSKMTTNFIGLRENLTIKQAMSELISQASQNDNISTLFIVDEGGLFYGAIDLKELILAREGTPLESLIMTSYPYVYGHESIDDCIERLKEYSEDLLPVLDNNNRLLGVITSYSLIEIVDDEFADDYAKLAGLTAEEDLNEPLRESMKKRLPWLFILLGLGIIVSSVVGVFEKVISELTLVMYFQSLILGMAGNVGTQSLAVTIRVLMDETLTLRQRLGLVAKEIRIGFFNGILLGVAAFGLIGFYILLVKGESLSAAFAVSACVGISLLVAMLASSAVGTLIPLFLKKIKVDPAVASGPLITTVNDLVAVVAYYGISWLVLFKMLEITGL